ncbi:MAG: anthranilate phosphoribosyltransferase [Verrucomicrobiae bacterium]|nr:anthranilate phosphoribosyltransferase [Verrucomicrobiae bacterium]
MSRDLNTWTKLVSEKIFEKNDVQEILSILIDDKVNQIEKVKFLIALTKRIEQPQEVADFSLVLREMAKPLPIPDEIRKEGFIDLCGTGGDGRNTFNVSTCASFVIAAAGIKVTKHGNRSITSKSGGFDLIEAFNITFDVTPKETLECFKKTNICFIFAQNYHPIFKKIAPLRKAVAKQGYRTIFNLIGPLINPAKPPIQLLGVPHESWTECHIEALSLMGLRRAAVVCGKNEKDEYMDELSPLGPSIWREWNGHSFQHKTYSPKNFNFKKGDSKLLEVKSAKESAEIITHILKGEDKTIRRDIVALNAGAGLFLTDKVKSLEEGVAVAQEILASGKAWKKLQQVLDITSRLKN